MKYEKRVYDHAATPKIVHGVKGLLHRAESDYLNQVADRVQGPGIYVDLGTFQGRSAILLADGVRRNKLTDVHIHTVDTFDRRNLSRRFREDGTRIEGTDKHPHKVPGALQTVRDNLNERDLKQYVSIVKSPSSEAVPYVPVQEASCIKFLFIDADHSYEGCKADWFAWRDYIHQDGEVAFHDSHVEGPKQVLAEEMKGWKQVDQIYSISVWHREGQ